MTDTPMARCRARPFPPRVGARWVTHIDDHLRHEHAEKSGGHHRSAFDAEHEEEIDWLSKVLSSS